MTTFAVTNSGDLLPAVNYLLSNLDTGGTGNVVLPGNVLVANTTTGVISQEGNSTPFGYLYQYVNLRYSNNATGTAGFDTNSNNYSYFGVYNSTNQTPSANPSAYQWYEVSPPFDSATSRTLYYSAIGGRQIVWAADSAPPSTSYLVTQANVAIDLDVVTTATGTPGDRGPIAMAFVITTADPNTATPTQLTNWFSASRTNTSPPIGTGLTPVVGDTATFTYTAGVGQPTATLTYNGSIWIPATAQVVNGNVIITGTLAGNAIIANTITATQIATNTITANNIQTGTLTTNLFTANTINANILTANTFAANTINGQAIIANTFTANTISGQAIIANTFAANTISGQAIDSGTITADKLAANVLTANTVISTGATIGNFNSQGFWLQGNTGNARFGNTISIGNNLIVGNNAQIGGNLTVSGLINGGSLNANTVATTTIQPAAVSSGISASSNTNQIIANPVQGTQYFADTTSTITTTSASQPVYVWAQVLNNWSINPISGAYVILIIAELVRTSSGGTNTTIFSQNWVGSLPFTVVAYQARPIWAGFIDTPGVGTWTYRVSARWINAGGSFTVPQLTFQERSILTQTLRR